MARTHTIPPELVHYLWDASNPPALHVESGDTVLFESRDVSDNQVGPGSTTADLATFDMARLYPLAGPVHVAGAEPGDTLQIDVLSLETRGWGWVALLPGLGLLADDFPDPLLRIFDLDPAQRGPDGGQVTYLRDGVAIPVEPFLGSGSGTSGRLFRKAVMPPGTFGGNIDTRQLTAGSMLLLPVQEPGALFSCGDAHAAQGDGEVCVTAIETALRGTFEIHVRKDMPLDYPAAETPTHRITMAMDPDLDTAAKAALRRMIDVVAQETGLTRQRAFMLMSLQADVRVTQLVNEHKGIHVMMPKAALAR